MAERVLNHEAGDAGSGVEDGQDEQRLEHDGEVIPQAPSRLAPPRLCEKMCAMPTANAGAPPVRLNSVCSPTAWARACMSEAVTGNPQEEMVAVAAAAVCPTTPAGTVNRKVNTGLQHTGGDDRHHRDGRLGHHGAVADHSGLGLARDQFGRGSAGDQSMEAADGPAGDGDEGERKNLSREYRAGAVHKAGERGHVQRGMQGDDADAEKRNRPQLHERAEIVARAPAAATPEEPTPQIRTQ